MASSMRIPGRSKMSTEQKRAAIGRAAAGAGAATSKGAGKANTRRGGVGKDNMFPQIASASRYLGSTTVSESGTWSNPLHGLRRYPADPSESSLPSLAQRPALAPTGDESLAASSGRESRRAPVLNPLGELSTGRPLRMSSRAAVPNPLRSRLAELPSRMFNLSSPDTREAPADTRSGIEVEPKPSRTYKLKPDDYPQGGDDLGPSSYMLSAIDAYLLEQDRANERRLNCPAYYDGEVPTVAQILKNGEFPSMTDDELEAAASSAASVIDRIDVGAWFPVWAKLHNILNGVIYMVYTNSPVYKPWRTGIHTVLEGDTYQYRKNLRPARLEFYGINLNIRHLHNLLKAKFKGTQYEIKSTEYATLYRSLYDFSAIADRHKDIPKMLADIKKHKDSDLWKYLSKYDIRTYVLREMQHLMDYFKKTDELWNPLKLNRNIYTENPRVRKEGVSWAVGHGDVAEVMNLITLRVFGVAVVPDSGADADIYVHVDGGGGSKITSSSTRNPSRPSGRPGPRAASKTSRAQAKPASAPAKRRRQSKAT